MILTGEIEPTNGDETCSVEKQGGGKRFLNEVFSPQVLTGRVAYISVEDAVHCRSGCSALRLRWVKLAPKSPVLF